MDALDQGVAGDAPIAGSARPRSRRRHRSGRGRPAHRAPAARDAARSARTHRSCAFSAAPGWLSNSPARCCRASRSRIPFTTPGSWPLKNARATFTYSSITTRAGNVAARDDLERAGAQDRAQDGFEPLEGPAGRQKRSQQRIDLGPARVGAVDEIAEELAVGLRRRPPPASRRWRRNSAMTGSGEPESGRSGTAPAPPPAAQRCGGCACARPDGQACQSS